MTSANTRRPIRSYVRRQGRMIAAQKQALAQFWPHYGIKQHGLLDLERLFGRQAPRHLEIGFGMGEALLAMAEAHPENDYLGVEVHLPGVGQLLLGLEDKGLTNVRIDRRDALEVLDCLPAESLAGVSLFFPDPWPKNRHRKRRLLQPVFVEKLKRVLAPGGLFHGATDSPDYARHMLTAMETAGGFFNKAGPGRFHPRPQERPLTRFEQRGLHRGHAAKDLLFTLKR